MILGFVSHAVGKFFCSALCKTLSLIFMIVTNPKTLLTKMELQQGIKTSFRTFETFGNQFNHNMPSQPDDINSDNPENTGSSKYYDIDEIQNQKITNNSNSLSLFHIAKCSSLIRTLMTFNT